LRQCIVSLILVLISTLYTLAAVATPNPQARQNATQCFSDSKAAYTYLQQQEEKVTSERQFTIDNALVNINSATEGELTGLKGIGSNKAQEIILYREAFGDFKRVEDLTLVQGIGEKTLAKNRHRLRVK